MNAANQYITATILPLEKYMKEGQKRERGDAANCTKCLINGGYQVRGEKEREGMS